MKRTIIIILILISSIFLCSCSKTTTMFITEVDDPSTPWYELNDYDINSIINAYNSSVEDYYISYKLKESDFKELEIDGFPTVFCIEKNENQIIIVLRLFDYIEYEGHFYIEYMQKYVNGLEDIHNIALYEMAYAYSIKEKSIEYIELYEQINRIRKWPDNPDSPFLELKPYYKNILEPQLEEYNFNGWIEYKDNSLTEGNTICLGYYGRNLRFYVVEVIIEKNQPSTINIDNHSFVSSDNVVYYYVDGTGVYNLIDKYNTREFDASLLEKILETHNAKEAFFRQLNNN